MPPLAPLLLFALLAAARAAVPVAQDEWFMIGRPQAIKLPIAIADIPSGEVSQFYVVSSGSEFEEATVTVDTAVPEDNSNVKFFIVSVNRTEPSTIVYTNFYNDQWARGTGDFPSSPNSASQLYALYYDIPYVDFDGAQQRYVTGTFHGAWGCPSVLKYTDSSRYEIEDVTFGQITSVFPNKRYDSPVKCNFQVAPSAAPPAARGADAADSYALVQFDVAQTDRLETAAGVFSGAGFTEPILYYRTGAGAQIFNFVLSDVITFAFQATLSCGTNDACAFDGTNMTYSVAHVPRSSRTQNYQPTVSDMATLVWLPPSPASGSESELDATLRFYPLIIGDVDYLRGKFGEDVLHVSSAASSLEATLDAYAVVCFFDSNVAGPGCTPEVADGALTITEGTGFVATAAAHALPVTANLKASEFSAAEVQQELLFEVPAVEYTQDAALFNYTLVDLNLRLSLFVRAADDTLVFLGGTSAFRYVMDGSGGDYVLWFSVAAAIFVIIFVAIVVLCVCLMHRDRIGLERIIASGKDARGASESSGAASDD